MGHDQSIAVYNETVPVGNGCFFEPGGSKSEETTSESWNHAALSAGPFSSGSS